MDARNLGLEKLIKLLLCVRERQHVALLSRLRARPPTRYSPALSLPARHAHTAIAAGAATALRGARRACCKCVQGMRGHGTSQIRVMSFFIAL